MRKILWLILALGIPMSMLAQENEPESKEAPAFSLLRATENYEYLKNIDTNPFERDFFDPIKFIPLNGKRDVYLSLGGQVRPRYEYYSNRFWEGEEDPGFYSQRLALYSNIVLGNNIRIFGELYHGRISGEEELVESDDLGIHQAFIDFKFKVDETSSLTARLGRQEMPFGAARLIGLREGPNIRRTFDATRLIYKKGKTKIQTFYAREVRPSPDAFDNEFTLFDGEAANPKLWGINSQFKINGLIGMTELYYFGFESASATFNDVTGKETRHTIGLRRFGMLKKSKRFRYNTEIMYQFGTLGEATISAFDIEGDWHYKLINTKWKTDLSLKLQYTSGDGSTGDNNIGTFNPMFVNPAYYSLAATITPVNIIGVHPAVKIFPSEKMNLYLEWAFFWRASRNDGLYRPPRFIARPAGNVTARGLGSQIGFKASYEFNRHLDFDLDVSYFTAGAFQEATGASESIFHIAPTLSYKF